MYNLKKRFGTINMTVPNEFEETVISFEKQLEGLSDENEKLKIKIKNLENEVLLLKQQNDIYKELLNKNDLIIEDYKKETITTSSTSPRILDFNEMKKVLEKENSNIVDDEKVKLENELNKIKKENERLIIEIEDIKDEYVKIQKDKEENSENINFNVFETPEFIKIKLEKEQLKQELNDKKEIESDEIDKLKEKIDSLSSLVNDIPSEEEIKEKLKSELEKDIEEKYKKMYESKIKKENRKKKENNKGSPVIQEYNVLNKYPIKVYKDIGESQIKKLIASEVSLKIKFQCKIAEETNKKQEDITMDDVINYIIKQESLSPQDKSKIKYRFERCSYLNDNYGEYLGIFKFSIYNLGFMSISDWELWVVELEKLIKENFKDVNFNKDKNHNCRYIFKRGIQKGKYCNIINCKRHNEID